MYTIYRRLRMCILYGSRIQCLSCFSCISLILATISSPSDPVFSIQLNPNVNAFQRKFVGEVRRCEELEKTFSECPGLRPL